MDDEITKTRSISDEINVDYCERGIRGVEFLWVSRGVPVEPLVRFLPRRYDEIESILKENGISMRNAA
jgi:uncharacterized protein YuzE